MMKTLLSCALISITLILQGCQQSPDSTDSDHVKTSKFGNDSPAATPRDALQIYFQGMIDGDLEAMKSVVIPFDQIDELFAVQIRLNKAMSDFNQAGAKKFGGSTRIFDHPTAAEKQQATAESVEIETDGAGHASCQLSERGPPLSILTEGNGWKMDLAAGERFLDSIPLQKQAFGQTAKLFQDLAREIEDGTIQSVQQVQSEMKKRRDQQNL